MLDWITLTIEAIGIAILVLWIIVPIGEFKSIYRALHGHGKTHKGGHS